MSDNVQVSVEGNELVVRIKMLEKAQESNSGKTDIAFPQAKVDFAIDGKFDNRTVHFTASAYMDIPKDLQEKRLREREEAKKAAEALNAKASPKVLLIKAKK